MTTFFISDTHFGHRGIIEMCGRPFEDINGHDYALIDAWNDVVSAGDTVWHLGDFAYRASPKWTRTIFDKLNGTKHLIWGNHDLSKRSKVTNLPWASQQHMAVIDVDGTPVTLCHYAMRTWWKRSRGAVQLYGHSHGNMPGNRQSCDVGVDVMGFAPITWQQIRAHLETLPEIAYDVHENPTP